MIAVPELRRMAAARLIDAITLYEANRYDTAFYLCGYAVELALKAQICETLGWNGFPSDRREFQDIRSYQTHNLSVLLHFSGIENHITNDFPDDWDTVAGWNPELQYRSEGQVSWDDCLEMLFSVSALLEEI